MPEDRLGTDGIEGDEAEDTHAWTDPPMCYRLERGDVVAHEQAVPDPRLDQRALVLAEIQRLFPGMASVGIGLVGMGVVAGELGQIWGNPLSLAAFVALIPLVASMIVVRVYHRRIRSQTGYPVPEPAAETVQAGHLAHILFLDLFATVRPGLRRWVSWRKFQGSHCHVWEQLLQALDVAERARRREDPATWVRRMVEVEDIVGVTPAPS